MTEEKQIGTGGEPGTTVLPADCRKRVRDEIEGLDQEGRKRFFFFRLGNRCL